MAQLGNEAAYLLSEAAGQASLAPLPKYKLEKRFLFATFYHPYVCLFIKQLNRDGIDGLLQRPIQVEPYKAFFEPDYPYNKFFLTDYEPDKVKPQVVETPYPVDDVDFLPGGTYSLYNWELFYHIPFLIADRLSTNQRFEEAQKWFHYIFDPTDRSNYGVPQRFWKTRPFFENADVKKTIEDLLELVNAGDPALVKQVAEWRHNPFNPHLIARLRITTYQKTVVMKYMDNLIAWGDQLFRRDTIESINEATQKYVLAAEVYGRVSEIVPPRARAPVKTYKQLEPDLDAFKNAVVDAENLVSEEAGDAVAPTNNPPQALSFPTFYFCIPKNEKLLGYWTTIADRLFKIRHCMNIEGVVRQLPLFEPPIDPALLVKAFAMGVDISSVLNDINAGLPHYRFNVMAQKAGELCNDVKALGAALLSALEKRDAEELAQLRSGHELQLLDAVRQVKEKQIDEAKEALGGLQNAKHVTEARRDYYRDIVKISEKEQSYMDSLSAAHTLNQIIQGTQAGVAAAHLIPDFDLGSSGWAGSPVVKARFGGRNLGNALRAAVEVMKFISAQHTHEATMASIEGGYERRWDDWKLQERLAIRELDQIDKQIAAADIRAAITERELQNHDLQTENAKQADEYMRDKFTNRELYDWMVSQISAVFFQSYQLAYDIAKRAERAFRFELGLTDSDFIQFGYWDSLRKGLLAGEKLHHDLKRMETAYLDQNRREYEITKHISLVQLDPVALVKLKEMGECFVDVPEAVYDLDYPGHYMRRIKSVALTIPCIAGPYTGVSCALTLLTHSVRKDGKLFGDKHGRQEDDTRFVDTIGAIQSVVTSNAQNDNGLFETNLRDERYLPFEGAGAISGWRIELPKEFRPFDYGTISDVILHVRYTAREGGGLLKQHAVDELQATINEVALAEGRTGLFRLFSARHEFPSEWHRFLLQKDAAGKHSLVLGVTSERFPFQFRGKTIEIGRVELFMEIKDGIAHPDGDVLAISLTRPDGKEVAGLFQGAASFLQGIPYASIDVSADAEGVGTWTLTAQDAQVAQLIAQLGDPDAIENVILICHYSVA